jgi:hypothetical protein
MTGNSMSRSSLKSGIGLNSYVDSLSGVLVRLLLAVLIAGGGWAGRIEAQPLGTGGTHKGVVPAGPYQIFPENRLGNGVYMDGTLLLSVPAQTILSAAQIAPGGRFIYVARGTDGKRLIGFNTLPGDTAPRITEPAKGFQYVVSGFDGQGYKKFFRVTDTSVADLLPTSRTADGLTSGPQGILFFHVGSTAGAAPGESVPPGAYGIRLHWLNVETGSVKHLGRSIFNGAPTIKLAWLDDGRIQYTLNDGKTETLSTADFR